MRRQPNRSTNCHSQTATHSGRNKRSVRPWPDGPTEELLVDAEHEFS